MSSFPCTLLKLPDKSVLCLYKRKRSMQIILLQLLSVLSQHQVNVELIKELTFKNKVILDERKNEVKILLIQFTHTHTLSWLPQGKLKIWWHILEKWGWNRRSYCLLASRFHLKYFRWPLKNVRRQATAHKSISKQAKK